ncbi:MAG: radical SAM-associated putative lipoprotein [Prevotella sp.]|nr:radical SAM-associated putative lipoprotein [Prevotella sp.]
MKLFGKLLQKALSMVMVALGFMSCSEDGPGREVCLYGSPTMSFLVKGRVADEAGKPLKGINIKLKEGMGYNGGCLMDSVFTDVEGHFQTKALVNTVLSPYTKIIFDDVDGEENGGTFVSDTVDIDKLDREKVRESDGHWYQGEYVITADWKLKRKP